MVTRMVRMSTLMNRGFMAPPRRPRNADSSSSGKTTKKASNKGRGAAPPKNTNPVTGRSTVLMRGGPNAGQYRTLTARTDMNLDAAARALRAAGGKATLPPPNVTKTSGEFRGNAAIGPVRRGTTQSAFRVTSEGGKAARTAAREGAARYSRTTKAATARTNASRNAQATARSTSRNVTSGARGNARSGASARQRMSGMPGLKGR